MFSATVIALATLASSVHALVIPRFTTPATYDASYLEPYDGYHIRYLALNCQTQHHTSFFQDCCHPLLKTENLKDNRKPYCTPSFEALSSASAAYEPTSTPTSDSGDDDCTENDEPPVANSPTPASDAPENVAAGPQSSDTPAPPPPASSSPPPAPSPPPPPPPAPSSPPPPPPAPSSPPPPAPSPPSNNGGGLGGAIGKFFGQGMATFFYQNGVAGACGQVHQDTDKVVALYTSLYGNGQYCGKTVQIQGNGVTVDAIVADECPTCHGPSHIDMSTSLFQLFGAESEGVVQISFTIEA